MRPLSRSHAGEGRDDARILCHNPPTDRGGAPMHWTERRQKFRAILKGPRCGHPGSVFDPISARIAEQLGFEIGMFAGSIASFTVLGAPDLVVLTLTEFAEQIRRITRAGAV